MNYRSINDLNSFMIKIFLSSLMNTILSLSLRFNKFCSLYQIKEFKIILKNLNKTMKLKKIMEKGRGLVYYFSNLIGYFPVSAFLFISTN